MSKKNRYRWGALDFSKPFPKIYKIMLVLGVFCLIGTFVLSAAEVLSGDSMSSSMSVVIGMMAIYGIAAPVSTLINFCIWKVGHAAYQRNAQKEAAKEEEKRIFAQEHPHYEQEQFYRLCKENGITDIETPAAVARMVLLAKNKGIPGSESKLIEAFKQGQADIARNEQKKKLAEMQYNEYMLSEDNLRYKEATGQQKRILMCRAQATHYREEEAHYRNQSRATHNAIFQVTSVPGYLNGMADGTFHSGRCGLECFRHLGVQYFCDGVRGLTAHAGGFPRGMCPVFSVLIFLVRGLSFSSRAVQPC